jgi:8-oxo-dGTP pyrophosphatase MutT (NUDIX family)
MDLAKKRITLTSTWNVLLVVVRNKEGKYLAINETRNRGWFLPAGKVEPGEMYTNAYR